MATPSVTGYVTLTGIVEKEGDQFVSYCRELGTASCGNAADEALESLRDALEVHINGLGETGELWKVFRENHIRIDMEPVVSETDELYIRVPPGKCLRLINGSFPPLSLS